jgi:hypothetical protein
MPFKDTPGLRRIVAATLEARDTVRVRIVSPDLVWHHHDGEYYREGDVFELPRSRAAEVIPTGRVELVDD